MLTALVLGLNVPLLISIARGPGLTVPLKRLPSHLRSSTTSVWRWGLGPHVPCHFPVSGSSAALCDAHEDSKTSRAKSEYRSAFMAAIIERCTSFSHRRCQPRFHGAL